MGHTRGGRVAGSVQGVPCPQESPCQSGHVPLMHLRRGSRLWQRWLDPCAGSSPQQHCHGVAASTGIALARYHPSGRSCLEALPALPKHGCALPGCLDPLVPRVSIPPWAAEEKPGWPFRQVACRNGEQAGAGGARAERAGGLRAACHIPVPAQAGRGPRRARGGRLQELDKGCGGCGRGAGSGLPKESRGRSRGLRVGSS